MPTAVAFFPWVYIDEPKSIGDIRLIPYRRGENSTKDGCVSQDDLDKLLSAYADRPNHLINKATIIETGSWKSGMDDQEVVSKLFRLQNLIAFSALSMRTLFNDHFNYCNYDNYSLVVQRFQKDSAGTFSFSTRRRDGQVNQFWSSDEFAFHRPIHVRSKTRMQIDIKLLESLLKLTDKHSHFYESLKEFNFANTDSSDVPVHVELVMIKSAFEWLFSIGEKNSDFVKSLKKYLPISQAENGIHASEWKERWPNEERPIFAWAYEFCALRGSAAHGKERGREKFVWSYQAHLAFASTLFPLMFKKVLAANNLMEFSDFDIKKLELIDRYLLKNPFDYDSSKETDLHPWNLIESMAAFST